jgi:protein-S-isoprenylcysteine O-methyltransferase Ste14
MTRARWGAVLAVGVYVVMALACLRQWGTSAAWSRVDGFSGGFLALLLFATATDAACGLGRIAFESPQIFREASGLAYDPATLVIGAALSIGDALVFLDYGHWRLVRALEHPLAQAAGLVLGIFAGAFLLWTDIRLTAHFRRGERRDLIRDGPFRYVRHPRYASTLAMRFALALAYASVIGWVLALAWLLVLLRRIRLEEEHLRTIFGHDYDSYATHTPRLIPRLPFTAWNRT